MTQPIDITGQRFGHLVAIEWNGKNATRHGRAWRCRCDCGALTEVPIQRLRGGVTRSCGCRKRTHGLSQHPLCRTWRSMHGRCKPTAEYHKDYFDRGIRVCDEWTGRDGLRAFIDYVATSMGPKPTPRHTLDRIDNDGNYEPGNIRWATQSEQICNQRHAKRKLTETAVRQIRAQHATGVVSFAALGREYGVSANAIRDIVLRRSWTYVTDCGEAR